MTSPPSSSSFFTIQTSDSLGRHVVATQKIPSGTHILTETPLLLAPDDAQLLAPSARQISVTSRCAMCMRRHHGNDVSLSECGSCALKLCATCLPLHAQHECRFVKVCIAIYLKLERRVPLMTLLAMMRAAAWRAFRPDDLARFDELFVALDKLQQAQPDRVALHEHAATLLAGPLGTTATELMRAYARFNLNSFSFTMGETSAASARQCAGARCRCRRYRRCAAVLARVVLQSLVLAQRTSHHRSRASVTANVVEAIADIEPGESIVHVVRRVDSASLRTQSVSAANENVPLSL
jgi:hypothetical protein